jgi:hypothetical protein
MGWLDNIGKGTAKEAITELEPIISEVVSRLRGVVYESLERFNGAKWELLIVDNKLVIEMKLPPVSPPAV